MNRCRGNINPPAGLIVTVSPQQHQANPSRPNRLRRSFRRTQQTQIPAEVESPKGREPEFKTPTRIQRPRAVGGFSAESPQNDSDFQQDIVWDATSPSPNRLGKRGKKPPVGVVNISEIVNRIAPKHGRPTVAEPTLQQWIGDSAAIPCTPDVQAPKPKKKSPRPNGVDDLLKLAKQFDFNMFHQDEDAAEELHQQSLELLSEDILDFENDFSPSPPGNCPPATKAAATIDVQPHPDEHMEDDLDFLFDASTQHVSGNLSQMASPAPPPRGQPAPKEASGKPAAAAPSLPPSCGVSTTHAREGAPANDEDEFEDDWANDDFLNDSLVLEMTQDPQNFAAPTRCSTQKTPGVAGDAHRRESPVAEVVQSAGSKVVQSAGSIVIQSAGSEVVQSAGFKVVQSAGFNVVQSAGSEVVQSAGFNVVQSAGSKVVQSAGSKVVQSAGSKVVQSAGSKVVQSAGFNVVQSAGSEVVQSAGSKVVQSAGSIVEKDSVRQRMTFKLESNPSFSARRIQTDAWANSTVAQQSRLSSGQSASVVAGGSQRSRQPLDPQKPPFHHRTSVPETASYSSAANAARSFPINAATVVSSRGAAPAASDVPDEDLSAYFASDPAWDDPADDDLLREMCDDLENQIQSAENVSARPAAPADRRAALRPSNRTLSPADRRAFPPQTQTVTPTTRLPGAPGRAAVSYVTATDSFRCSQAKSTNVSPCVRGSGPVQPAPRGNGRKDQFTFKKPSNAVSTVTSKVVGKCSAAEIELKKQQAMERRRRRLQAAGNLRAPT